MKQEDRSKENVEYIRKRREERGELPMDKACWAEAMGLKVLSPEQAKDALCSFEKLANLAKD